MSDMQIQNPVLKGFNPDPAILCVGSDYYIASSTFQWFPGVQIHHSRDLVNWQRLGGALTRVSQLDMVGNPAGGGIWAPCLSWCDGVFYLIYTNTRSNPDIFVDAPNYLVTAEDIRGPWSEPVYLNSSGFDPSLFHDDDGRKWLVNMIWDHRVGANRFAGIALQEYSPEKQALIGSVKNIFRGTNLGATEGPHIYKRNGWYYLMVAEGGTGYGHAVTMARSRNIDGPYEVDPQNPMLTSRDRRHDTGQVLQKAGHASLVETQNGKWYLAHLTGRPFGAAGTCPLGRETAIQQVCWSDDGWLRKADGGYHPDLQVPSPELEEHKFATPGIRDDFDETQLSVHFNTLRQPAEDSWLSLTGRPGWLSLRGRKSLSSNFDQSLIARRVEHFSFRIETKMEFTPDNFQQMAGLVLYYNTTNWRYLHVSCDDEGNRCLNLYFCTAGKFAQMLDAPIMLADQNSPAYLAMESDNASVQCRFSLDATNWQSAGRAFELTKLSDETCGPCSFTGTMAGVCCQDLSAEKATACFDWFDYEGDFGK